MKGQRLGTSFHESFSLNRPALAAILSLSRDSNGRLTPGQIRARAALGSNYVKAMPRYARGCGLMVFGGYGLTPLGETVLKNDPGLNDATTLWLLHYHLSAPQGPGPLFWHHVTTTCLPPSGQLETQTIAEEIGRYLELHKRTRLGERTARTAATILLGTYAKTDGLGGLNLLEPAAGGYRVLETGVPPKGAAAYALADYWQSVLEDRVTIDLTELAAPGGFANLFFLSSSLLLDVLRGLQNDGLLELQRAVPPYQAVRLWRNKAVLLEKLYALR